jgi:nucleotide-binding universal stress UspA family protein
MAFKDILVALTSYPDPTPAFVVEDAVSIAAVLGAHIAAIACETRVQLPGHVISVPAVSGIIATEAGKSRKYAHDLLAAFDAAAEKAGILHETILEKAVAPNVPGLLTEYARLRDLTIVSSPESYDQWTAETIIFGSGRPTLILPETPRPRPFSLGTVARAVSDALPILELARKVRIVTVVNEKALPGKHSGEGLARNLARHGIDVVLDEIDGKDRSIGETIESYTASHGADLLVMGAYGHSRLREFVLGGATRSLLSKAPLPLLLSH